MTQTAPRTAGFVIGTRASPVDAVEIGRGAGIAVPARLRPGMLAA